MQLTESTRKLEAVQVEAARAQLLLEHEKSAGSTAQDEGSRLTAALTEERRARQRLAQELAAERALRTKAEEGGVALQREIASRQREAELAAQRVAQLEAELQLARTEASEAAGVREFAESAQREREALHREQRERAAFERERAQQRRGNCSALGECGVSRRPPSAGRVGLLGECGGALAGALNTTRENPYGTEDDELGRSDLWNFSSGMIGRSGGAKAPRNVSSSPSLTLPQIKGAVT